MMKTIEGYTYKINENIGKGYSSTVHKGIKDQTGEQVAIKVIEMVKLQDPINQMLLQHQITALKHLSASHYVLHLYDVYATKNNTYIITELCEGDLASMIKSRRLFPYHQAVQILKQIINGYYDIHNAGYLHRDIKPANIFHRKGSFKIGDFGFAIPRFQIDKHKDYNVGSPVYMPPEALKDNIYSVSCDTWAIGIIFYQMIKGMVPWRAISEQALHKKIISQPLQHLTVGMPQVARVFLSKILSLDPTKRMSIQQMLSWPAKLMNFDSSNKTQLPLCQIKINNNLQNLVHNNSQTNIRKMPLTPKQNPNKIICYQQPMPSMKHVHSQNQTKQYFSRPSDFQNIYTMNNQDLSNKENYGQSQKLQKNQNYCVVQAQIDSHTYANSILNYLKFMHKTLKFIGAPTPIYLEDLQQSLKSSLKKEIKNFNELIITPQLSQLNGWQQYLSSQKGKQFKDKFSKLHNKYAMFHIPKDESLILGDELLKAGIFALLQNLESPQNFNSKSVIAADYLTTLYQLFDLKQKYTLQQFFKKSKLDLILKGSPYSATSQNLEKLRKKISLIDLFN